MGVFSHRGHDPNNTRREEMSDNIKTVLCVLIVFAFLSICAMGLWNSSCSYYSKLKYIERYELSVRFKDGMRKDLSFEVHETDGEKR